MGHPRLRICRCKGYISKQKNSWLKGLDRDTGQHSGNGVWDLERKSCSLIIKKSVWWVQMELSHRSMHTHVCGVCGILCSRLKLSRKKNPTTTVCQKICSNSKMDDLAQELSLRSYKQMQKYSRKIPRFGASGWSVEGLWSSQKWLLGEPQSECYIEAVAIVHLLYSCPCPRV